MAIAVIIGIDSIRSLTAWEFLSPAPATDYRGILIAQGRGWASDTVLVGLAVRDVIPIDDLERVTLPSDENLLAPPILYYGRTLTYVRQRLLDDIVNARVERAEYDPVIGAPVFDDLVERGQVREFAPGIFVDADPGAANSFILLVDEPGQRFVLLAEDTAGLLIGVPR